MKRRLIFLITALGVFLPGSGLVACRLDPGAFAAGGTATPAQKPTDPRKEEFDRLYAAGKLEYRNADYVKAIEKFKRCLELATELGNQQARGVCLSYLGIIDEYLGSFDEALAFHTRALEVRRSLGNKDDIAASLNNQGNAHWEMGQLGQALDSYSQALDVGSSKHKGASLTGLGVVNDELGRCDKALRYDTEALALARGVDDQIEIGNNLNNLGAVYFQLGRFDKSRDFFGQALEIKKRTSDQRDVTATLGNVGLIYAKQRQFKEALDISNQVLSMERQFKNQMEVAASLNNVGNVYVSMGQFEEALARFNEALPLARQFGPREEVAMCLDGRGIALERLHKFDQALASFQESLAIRRQIGSSGNIAKVLNNQGNAYEHMAQLDKAVEAYGEAEHLYETVSQQVGDPSAVGAFQAGNEEGLYVRFARTLGRQGKMDRALEQLERGRAQGLARQVEYNQRDQSEIFSSADSSRLAKARQASVTASKLLLSAKENLALATGAQRDFFEAKVKLYAPQAAQAAQDLELLKDELYAKYPDFALIGGKKPPNPEELAHLARHEPDTLFLEYGQGPESLVLMSLHGKSPIGFIEIDVAPDELAKQVNAYNMSVTAGLDADEQKLSKQLYTTLLGKLKLDPATTKRIVFVPDGAMQDLPLSSLIGPDGKRLIENYAVSTTISLGMLTANWNSPRDSDKGLLVVSDPTGGATGVSEDSARGTYGPLPAARKEGAAVASLFPGAVGLIGEAAREAVIKQQMDHFAILHFACHGYLNSVQAMLSGLILAPEPTGSPDEGMLTAKDVVERKLSAQLAVLSACQTGEGLQSGGEGLMGLAWAFRAAGCPAVVASKWEVDDDATARIMVSFYKHLRNHERKDDALRQAMLQEMHYPEAHGGTRGNDLKSPGAKPVKRSNAYYWAAFQVIGDCKPLADLPAP